MLNIDEIRKEAAVRHGLILENDDPALELVKINEIVLERSLQSLTDNNLEHYKKITNEMQQSVAASKVTAGKLITDAADYVSEAVNAAVTSAMDEAMEKIRTDVIGMKEEMSQERNTGYALGSLVTLVSVLCGWALWLLFF